MKKILAFVLVAVLAFSLVACGGNEVSNDDSAPVTENVSKDGNEENVSKEESNVNEVSEDEDVSEEDTSVPSDESETSSDESEVIDNPSQDEKTIPAFISNFVTWAELTTKLRATDNTSIQLTAVNKDAAYGDVVIYTYEYANDKVVVEDGNYADYAFLIAEYDSSVFGCAKKEVYTVGSLSDNSSLTVPDDGFIIAAHKDQTVMAARLSECAEDVMLYAAGVQTCDVNYSISKTGSAMVIDGKVGNEWTQFKIDTIDESNHDWAYWSFEEGDYYTTAEYYVAYDNDNLYLAVVVNSPFHYCPLSAEDARGMYAYECIQVKLTTISPKSDYYREHYDHVIDSTANKDGYIRAYGFAVNDDGDTLYYENSGVSQTFAGSAVCTRDDSAQLTVYEVSIPWSSLDINVSELETFGLTFSINSTNELDVQNGTWRNLVLRDGGGVIKRNDWAKIPEVTIIP